MVMKSMVKGMICNSNLYHCIQIKKKGGKKKGKSFSSVIDW